jgi:hypothetical protein
MRMYAKRPTPAPSYRKFNIRLFTVKSICTVAGQGYWPAAWAETYSRAADGAAIGAQLAFLDGHRG